MELILNSGEALEVMIRLNLIFVGFQRYLLLFLRGTFPLAAFRLLSVCFGATSNLIDFQLLLSRRRDLFNTLNYFLRAFPD
jgi:lipoprotein signal peptidase